jgi:glycosyltransferase involved in cell wall biosynthesis
VRVAWFGHVAGRRGNGLITYSRDLTSGLRRAGHDVTFFYHGGSESDPQAPDHIRIGALDILDRTVISSMDAPRIISETLRTHHADVAHASLSWSLLDFALPDVCHEAGVPIVCTLHFPYDMHATLMGNLSRTMYRVYATILARYDRFIVFSQAQRKMLAGMGIAEERVAVIPNGVDEHVFSPGASTFKDELGASTVVTFLGRVDPEKNVGVLCDVFQRLDPPSETKLVIVGTGMEADALQRRFGGDARIIFAGVIKDVDKRVSILRASDVFVLPSKVEGLSLAMLEAMSCGCPTIATDVGSDGEALSGAGIVIDPEALQPQLHLALRTLLDYPDFRRSLGPLARRRVEERYSLNKNISQVIHLYQTTIQGA